MSSSFKTLDLFGSGPHRFAVGRQSQLIVIDFYIGGGTPDGYPIGLFEFEVIVTGRLIAASESGLWTLRDAVTAQLIDPPTSGTLVDLHGRTWADMSFVGYEEEDRVDRGRERSIGYRAVFRRFNQTP